MASDSQVPTARGLAAEIAARKISAREAVAWAIARIERCDGAINAVVVRDFERALAAADAADAALARGERMPLLGVPITVKESFHTAGLPSTWGMPWNRGWIASEDAVTVARLKAAGAILIGKTNVPFALGDWQSYNEIYGTTNNPWNLARSPGGSSGGSAASLAAGYVPLELGTDIAGSLRVPAHFCGVTSHKPSRGVVPGRGHTPPGVTGATPDLATPGPMARNAADLLLAFDIVSGPDVVEAAAGARPPAPRHTRLDAFRVLALDAHPLFPVDATMRAAMAELVARLRAGGVNVATESPLVPDLTALAKAYLVLLHSVLAARMPEDVLATIVEEAAPRVAPDDDSPVAWRVRGMLATYRQWLAADVVRVRCAAEWHALTREFDVVLYPPMPTVAFPQDQSDLRDRTIDIDGIARRYDDQELIPGIANALGIPATTVPVAKSPDGLPIGVQIMGPYWEDRTTLEFACLLEQEYGGIGLPNLA